MGIALIPIYICRYAGIGRQRTLRMCGRNDVSVRIWLAAPKITYGELAQLGERLPCKQEVTGSTPVFSTSLIIAGRLRTID